jgi:5-methyltetrahydrofolate--homocysteine methyltransferase
VPIYQAVLQTLSQNTSFNVSAHPNAGLPNAFEYDETPEQMQAFIKEYLDDNLYGLLWNNTSTHQVNCRYRQGINREFR